MNGKQLITHSRQAAFKTCRRRHYYDYELGLRRIDDARALRMGSAFHAGLEWLSKSKDHTLLTPATCDCNKEGNCNICDGGLAYCTVCKGGEIDLQTTCNVRLACAAVRERYADCPEQFDLYEWSMECETILRLVCAYDWRWSAVPLEYVATETTFQLPLINPHTGAYSTIFDVAGKIDGIVRLEDGRLAVKESKTTSEDISPNSDFWRRLRIDHQISLYIDAARRMGHQVDTVLYDVTRKPSIQPTPVPILDADGLKIVLDRLGNRVMNKDGKKPRQTASTEDGYVLQTRPMTTDEWGEKLTADVCSRPDFYFARVEVPRLDQDVEDYRQELWEIQQAIREAQRTGRWFRTVSRNSCPYCPHFDHCSTNQRIDPLRPPLGFQILNDPHPELELERNLNVSASTNGTAETAAVCAASREAL